MKMPGHSAWYLVGTVRAAASGRSFVAAEQRGATAQVCRSATASNASLVLAVARYRGAA